MPAATAAARERPKAAVVIAVLLIVAGLTLGPAREVIAYTFSTGYDTGARGFARDTDGRVPESPGDSNPGPPQPRDWHVYGRTSVIHYSLPAQYLDSITYDWPESRWCNAPENVIRSHERAHSRGWGHNRGSPSTNPAYNPSVRVCQH